MKSLAQLLPVCLAFALPAVAAHAADSGPDQAQAPATTTTTTTTTTSSADSVPLQDNRDLSFPTIGVTAGSRGLDPVLGFSVNPFFSLRAVGAYTDVDYSTSRNGIDYKGKYDFRSVSLLGDWFPGAGPFHFTVGAVRDKDRFDAYAQPGSNGLITVNGGFPLAPGDQLKANAHWVHRNVPYVGLGWGNPSAHHQGIGLSFDLGAMYTRQPRVALTVSGPDAGNPVTQSQVRQEQDKLNADLNRIKFFPVASLGIYYGF
jgi:hypothetical protein